MTKTCTWSFTEIDARARKCPHCLVLQGPWRILLPLAIVVPILLLGGLLFSSIPRPSFDNYASNVEILTSEMYFAPTKPEEDLKTGIVVGQGKNGGTKCLSSIFLQVQVFDKDDKLIDLYDGGVYASVAPNQEFPFKVIGGYIHLPESEYASHKVIVTDARESY